MFQCGKIFCNYVLLQLLWGLRMLRNVELDIIILTIFTGKNYFNQFSARINRNRGLVAIDLFHIFTQLIKFYTFCHHILKSTDVRER